MPDYSLNWTARSTAIQRWQRRQVINLTPPRRVKTWGDGPLRLEELTVRRECQTVCWKAFARNRSWSNLKVILSERHIDFLLHSCTLGRLIWHYHYISLKLMGLMPLVGLVLLLSVSFSGLLCFPYLSPVFLSLGDLDLSCTDLWWRFSSCIIWFSSKFSNSFWPTWSCIISSSDVSFCKGCSNKSLTEGIVEISFSFCSLYSQLGLIWSPWAYILFPFSLL